MTIPLIKFFVLATLWVYACTLNAQVQINEFMAVNSSTLSDEDQDYPDWIELKNTSAGAVDLTGWYLSDDIARLTRWRFPATNILPGAMMIVFASDKNRSVSGKELHTNFKLTGDGEYLGLVLPDGTTVAHAYHPAFPPQLDDLSYGLAGGVVDLSLLAGGTPCTAWVPTDALAGTSWHLNSFDDSAWSAGTLGVGYETGSGYQSLFNLNLLTAMYNKNTTAYIRIPFTLPPDSDLLKLTLRMKYDDGFVAFINGVPVASANAPATLGWQSAALGDYPDSLATVFAEFDITASAGALLTGANMLAIHALNSRLNSSDMLIVPELECRIATAPEGAEAGYLINPTPGAENTAIIPLTSEPVLITPAGRLCSAPVAVELAVPDSAEKIYYTLDGSEPSLTSSVYTGTIPLSTTTTLRARSFQSGRALGRISSETYLFLDSGAAAFNSDLPIVIVDNLGRGDIPATSSQSAFLAFFEPGPDGRTRLTNNFVLSSRAGIRRRGESSLRATNLKPNLAVEFWGAESDDDAKIRPLGMPSESDWILWAPYDFDRAGIRNAFMYNLSNQSGNYAVRTRFVEVFLNAYGGDVTMADYAGLYVFMEKIKRDNDRVDVEALTPQDNAEPALTGGYILRIDKDDPAQNLLTGMTQPNLYCIDPLPAEITPLQESYISRFIIDFEAQLRNPDPATGYPAYINQAAFIDHNLLNMLAKNVDALRISTYMYKPRSGKLSMGPIWDFDRSLESTDSRDDAPEGWVADTKYIDYDERARWWGPLFENADFWQQYIDRWQTLRANVLSDTNIAATIAGLAAEVAEARVRDIARWSRYPRTGANGLDGTQQGEVNHMQWWLAARMAWIDAQFIAPPVFDQIGRAIEAPIPLSITAPAGTTIYYTTDGSDPRAPGGLPAPSATALSGTLTVQPGSFIQARAWNGSAWGFNPPDERPWSGLTSAVFADTEPQLLLTEVHYNPAPATAPSLYDNDDFEFVELCNTSSDTLDLRGYALSGGIGFSFSGSAVESLEAGEFVVVVRNLAAFASRYNTSGMQIAGAYAEQLANSGENIRLEFYGAKLFDIAYNDDRGWPAAADGGGPSLIPINDALGVQGFDILDYPGNWRASTYIGGSPGAQDPVLPAMVVINELTAHTDTGLAKPYDSNDQIELYNLSAAPVTLDSHWYLSDDPKNPEKWNIPAGTVIPAKGWLLFDENDFHPGRLTGFGLDKAGEMVVLSHRPGNMLDRIADCIDFQGQANGASWGRCPDGNAFTQTLQPTPGTANRLPPPGIHIQELMYNPWPAAGISADDILEYIMLTNASPATILFDGAECTNTWRLSGGVDYSFASGTSLAAGERLWLVPFDPAAEPASRALFCSTYALSDGSVRLLGPYSGRLSNSGERLALERPQSSDNPLKPEDISWMIVDEVIWLDEAPWPAAADGTGLALLRTGSAGNDPLSWTVTAGMGPGFQFAHEKLSPGTALWNGFTTIPNLSDSDYADTHSGNNVSIALASGTLAPVMGQPSILINGAGALSTLDFKSIATFFNSTPGRFKMDLQRVIPLTAINSFAWHTDIRQNQHYDLYYSKDTTAPASDSSITDLNSAGWTFLGNILTTYDTSTTGQIGVHISSRFGGTLIHARHLLWDIKPGSTFYGEFDVWMNGGFVTNRVPELWLSGYALPPTDAGALADSDGDGLCNWEEYYAGTDPLSAQSLFRITGNIKAGAQQQLRWSAVAGKTYRIEFSPDLPTTGWTPLVSGIPGVAPECSWTLPAEGTQGFLRVTVE